MAELVYIVFGLIIFIGVIKLYLDLSPLKEPSPKTPSSHKFSWSVNFHLTSSKEFKKLVDKYGEDLVEALLNDYLVECEKEEIPLETLLELSPTPYRRLSSLYFRNFLISLIMLDLENELKRRSKL